MPRILILSSYVAMGHVGLSAGQPVCQRLGVDVTAVPTTVLSNHPGWPHVAHVPVAANRITALADALSANGWLGRHDALLLGYMPSADHVDAATDLVRRLRDAAPHARIVLDPILGDRPKGLYVPEEVAEAVRVRLLPLADVLTPNHFELEWLARRDCPDLAQTEVAARALGVATVHVTSPPLGTDETGVLSLADGAARVFRTRRHADVPQGIGDVFAALIASGVAVGQAVGHVQALAFASRNSDHLEIVARAADWIGAAPVAAD